MGFELPQLDKKATQRAVEEALEKYRIFKYLTFEEREASITASSEVRYHGPTNQTSDQTGDIATHNVVEQQMRKKYCSKIEKAVSRLPYKERFLIEKRYLVSDADYIFDYKIYNFVFDPPISSVTYSNYRWKAFYKLALDLNIAVTKEE